MYIGTLHETDLLNGKKRSILYLYQVFLVGELLALCTNETDLNDENK